MVILTAVKSEQIAFQWVQHQIFAIRQIVTFAVGIEELIQFCQWFYQYVLPCEHMEISVALILHGKSQQVKDLSQ